MDQVNDPDPSVTLNIVATDYEHFAEGILIL
jgi:hypothetical protein